MRRMAVAVRAFAIPIYWLTLLLAAIVVKLLVAAGFLYKEKQTISAKL